MPSHSHITPSQFAWRCLARGDYPPPVPRRGLRYGPDADCWLCGHSTHGVGWPMATAVPPTFTNHTVAKSPHSTTICQECAALGSKQAWESYIADRPDMGLKTGHAMSWRCYSHVFAAGLHECPTRVGWRMWLLDPPEPPFLFVVALSGQKHLIFRSRIAHNRAVFPVQVEEESLWLDRRRFVACLSATERLYDLGFSKESIVSGRYHHGQLHRVGLAAWRAAEAEIVPWRRGEPHVLALACHVAKREENP